MMTVGTPVSANGAEAYFKADFVKQETLPEMSADKNNEADENTPIETIADAEEVLTIVNNSEIEDSDGENSTVLEDENSIAESEPTGRSGSEEPPAADLTPRDSTAEVSAVEVSAVKNSSAESPVAENPIVKNSATENPITENSSVEQSNSGKDGIDFAQTRTRWIGKLSEELGLTGEVSEKEFAALSRGIHPQTGERFIRHVKPRTMTDERGKTRQTKSHRAGLDQTLNAPKSVSLVAPYDDRIITAHWRSAIKAVETIEEFTTAKMGNVKLPERTGKAAYAAFLHFEARPDFKSNYAAPDLHTHFFEFNFARTADGRHRALETREIYRCQKLATAVYRSELVKEMTKIGYQMRIDAKTGAPEVASISRAYIEASSPRQTEIKRTAEELGIKSTKIVASNYRRGKNFDPAEMRRRWDAMDAEFGSQAAKAAEQARHRTEMVRAEHQTLSPQKQISDSLNTANRTDVKTAAAVDFAIAQAKEQKDIEVLKRKWITRQSLLTETLNYSPAELTIDQVKAEFGEREKNGELLEFELDRRKTKNRAERENPNAEKASSATVASEGITNKAAIKSDEPASFRNLKDTKTSDERLTHQRQETFRADTKTATEDSLLKSDLQKPAIQDQTIKINPTMTARLETPALESETAVEDSLSEQLPPLHRKDFAGEEKSAAEAPPNPETSLEKIETNNETNNRETIEVQLEVNQDSEESFQKIYDETGNLQSRTHTSGSRRSGSRRSGENDIAADRTESGEYRNWLFRDERLNSGGDNTSESNVISSDDAASNNAFIRSTGTGDFKSNLTDFRPERQQENGDSEYGTQTGKEQNSVVGRRERELPDRSGSAGSGQPDDRRIVGGGVGKSESGGEPGKLPFKPIESVENENAVQAKPDFQPETVEMETTPRLESGARVAQIKIAGAKFTPFRDNRTDDQAARGGHEIAGNDGENFDAVKRDTEENTGIDAKNERRVDRREKRDEESENKYRRAELGAASSRTADDFGETEIGDSDTRTGTLSSQVEEPQVRDGKGFESEGFTGTRISTRTQRAAGDRTSEFEKTIGEDGGGNRINSAKDSGGEGIGVLDRGEMEASNRWDKCDTEVFPRAADSASVHIRLPLYDEQRFKRESGSGGNEIGGNGEAAKYSTKGQNGDRADFQQYDNDTATDVPGRGETLQSAGGGADEDRSGSTDTNRRTAEKTAQIINIKRFSGGLDSQIVEQWTATIEKSDAADFLNEVIKPKSREEEQQLFGHLDAQAAQIARQLKLPPPEPEAQPNALKLAVALTEIEVANYEQASGEPQSDKVFEVLVKENMRRHATPEPEQIERLRETFGDTPVESTVKPSSDLEAETLNALLDSVRCGFDAAAVIRAQRDVNTNEAAAQATATLVQIAYGGQTNAFTDKFKNDLAEQIYYAPVPANDAYQNFRQFDWRQTIENFAPTINNLAEQYKIEIKPPDGDLERNKLLADFVARQLVEAYESRNSPMEKYVQNQLTANILRVGSLEVTQPQKDTIDALTDQNLEPPKFSNALEASAYNTTKYDDEKKATQAISLADQIREAAQLAAEKQAAIKTERVQVLRM